MCPGGIVVPSASEEGGVVTNGMSYYARDGKNANSAVILLSVDTNYELKPETLTAPNAKKLDPNKSPHDS